MTTTTPTLSKTPIIDEAATILLDKLRINPSALTSAVSLIQLGADVMRSMTNAGTPEERKIVLLRVLEKIAAGVDGVQGTQDDLIPTTIMNDLKLLLQTKMATDMISLISELQNVDFKETCKCLPFCR